MNPIITEIERRASIADAASPPGWFARKTMHVETMLHAFIDAPGSRSTLLRMDGFPEEREAFEARKELVVHARTGYPEALAALKLAVEELQRQAGSAEEPKDTMADATLRAIAEKLGVRAKGEDEHA